MIFNTCAVTAEAVRQARQAIRRARRARPGVVVVESRLPEATVAELRRRGHVVEVGEPWSEGRLTAASRDPDGRLKAAANPRGMQGYAAGR